MVVLLTVHLTIKHKNQDIEADNRKVQVYGRNYTFVETRWKKLRVCDIIKVYKDVYFPADLLLLSSSYGDGICYVETMNLDGETNLKLKHALEVTIHLQDEKSLQKYKILLRDSKLKNTDYIYGIVIFTGYDTKVMQNSADPPSKGRKIERKMDKIIYILFSTLVLISFIGSVFFGVETKRNISSGRYRRWYLRLDNTTVFYDPRRATLVVLLHLLAALMLYGYLIPISLYVSIELVKVL
ncbi:hypothetical protein JHK87_011969 [Glycine soja]|nr:hypothetical protein JHK87_011969 [Glycine soja]